MASIVWSESGTSFTASIYFASINYVSWYNESIWHSPPNQIVDDCGPANIVSAGSALWLVLVPAVACVVQLPGSTFLHGRSNLYRFAPEIGLADALATATLVLRTVAKGYAWNTAVAGVLVVREAIGNNDMWWRGGNEVMAVADGSAIGNTTNEANSSNFNHTPVPPEISPGANSQVDISLASEAQDSAPDGDVHTDTEDALVTRAKLAFEPYSSPLSAERIIGLTLFIISLIKTIAILSTQSNNPALKLATSVAIAYSVSFIVFELLVWSLVFTSPQDGYSLQDLPLSQTLELLRAVDPGDNPFALRPSTEIQRQAQHDGSIELGSVSSPANADSLGWSKIVAACACSTVVFGAVLWALLLRSIWSSNLTVFLLTLTCLAFFTLRVIFVLSRSLRRHLSDLVAHVPSTVTAKITAARRYLQIRESNLGLFLIRWTFHRVTTVNLFSLLWISVIFLYYTRSWQSKSGNDVLLKPMWLDWLG